MGLPEIAFPLDARPEKMARMLQSRGLGYLAAILGIAAVTAICALLRSHINEMTVALAMLLVVLFIAAAWGRWPGLVASVLGMLCLNYFFLPPIYTFTIADPKNWIALTAFFITALTAGQLSAWVKQRAAEAEASRSQARLASTYNRSLLEASLDPLMTIGHDGKINDVNAAAETVTGRSRAELIGTDFSKYFREPEKARAAYEQVFRGDVVRGYALELRHRDGHSTSVLYDGSLYRDAERKRDRSGRGHPPHQHLCWKAPGRAAGSSGRQAPESLRRFCQLLFGCRRTSVAGWVDVSHCRPEEHHTGATRHKVQRGRLSGVARSLPVVAAPTRPPALLQDRKAVRPGDGGDHRLCGPAEPDRTYDRMGPGYRPTAVPRTRRGRFL